MQKLHHILLFFGILLMVGCADDTIINSTGINNAGAAEGDGRISLVQQLGNMTRSATQAHRIGHYEFGVWAYKGEAANRQYPSDNVMDDYLVAYTDGSSDGINSWYKELAENSETYGNDAGGDQETIPGDGTSSWFYEGLGTLLDNYKKRTSPDASIQPLQNTQVLKYWDKSAAYHNFFAYAPYFGHQAGVGASVELSESEASPGVFKSILTYDKLSNFYTDPVATGASSVYQVSTANTTWAGDYTPSNLTYNDEVLNANEGLYAVQSIAKANYGKDVPLTFKHINAKIKIAFYEAVNGYKVALLDLVPETEAGHIYNNDIPLASALTGERNLIPASGAYEGVALSPATREQAESKASESTIVTSAHPLPSYYTQAKTIATDVKQDAGITADASISLADGASDYTYANDNLRFQKAASNTSAVMNGGTSYDAISEAGGLGASVLNTKYYTLPNYSGSGYLTQNYSANYTTQKVAQNTGYTLHVSYILLPEDGSDPDKIYDARVWIAPEYCRWEAGKQYTYVFKITEFTNGTTLPYTTSDKMFQDGDDHDPYVDPDDPRVPCDMALVPIIFDNVFVSDYEKGDYDASYLNVLNWQTVNYSSTDYKYCPVLMTGTEYVEALDHTPASPLVKYVPAPAFPASAFTFDDATRKFGLGSEMSFFADAKETYSMTVTDISSHATFDVLKDENEVDVTSLARVYWNTTHPSGTIDLPKYSMHIWTAGDATTAEKYTATPVPNAVTVVSKVKVMQTRVVSRNNKCYKLTTKNYTTGTTTVKYYNASDVEITESAYNTLKASEGDMPATYNYTFSYSYKVSDSGYSLSSANVSGPALPKQAYGIAKQP